MSLTENGGGMQYTMGVQPTAYTNGGGFGGGWGDGSWILILLVLCLFGGGWGGGFGGGMWPMMMMGGMGGFGGWGMDYLYPWLNNSQHISDGFRDQNPNTQIGDLRTDVNRGFGDVQLGLAGVNQSLCQTGNNITGALRDGFYGAETAANARQMANMQQLFGLQTQAADCCCKTQTNIADLKYTVASESCATRNNDTQNTQAVLNAINGGIQSIKDQLCQDKIDAKNDEIAQLRQEINMQTLAASQAAQNAFIQQGFSNEVDQLYNRLSNCPVPSTPVYGRTPIFTCNNGGCGCGNNGFAFAG